MRIRELVVGKWLSLFMIYFSGGLVRVEGYIGICMLVSIEILER